MGLRPIQGDEKSLRPATTLYRTVAPSFVIPSEAEGSAVPRTFRGNVFPSRCTETFGAHRKTLFAQHVRGSLYFLLSRADSMAAVTCGESGVTAGSNRSSGLPLRSNRNLVKFHLISPPICGLTDLSVRKA